MASLEQRLRDLILALGADTKQLYTSLANKADKAPAVYPEPDFESDVNRILYEKVTTAPMPANDGPGWNRVWEEDFVKPAAKGAEFLSVYGDALYGYPDGYKDTETQKKPLNYGWYYPSKVLFAEADGEDAVGVMKMHIHTESVNGTPIHMVAAPQPRPDNLPITFGRFSVRVRRKLGLPGYKFAFLLWPDNNNWNDGEYDFPENNVEINHHSLTNPNEKPYIVELGPLLQDYHVYTIEWYTSTVVGIPLVMRYLLDGEIVQVATRDISDKPHHWSWQVETNIYDGTTAVTPPADNVEGYVEIDWGTISTQVAGYDRTIVRNYNFTGTNGTPPAAPAVVKTGTNTGTNTIESNRLRQVTSTVQWSMSTVTYNEVLTDCIIQATCKFPSTGGSCWLGFKWNPTTNAGYAVRLTTNTVQFGRMVNGTFTLVSSAALTTTAGADYKVKVRPRAGGVFVKVWLASAAEPAEWTTMTTNEATPRAVTETFDYTYTRGGVALMTQTSVAGTAATGEWDDLVITIP